MIKGATVSGMLGDCRLKTERKVSAGGKTVKRYVRIWFDLSVDVQNYVHAQKSSNTVMSYS